MALDLKTGAPKWTTTFAGSAASVAPKGSTTIIQRGNGSVAAYDKLGELLWDNAAPASPATSVPVLASGNFDSLAIEGSFVAWVANTQNLNSTADGLVGAIDTKTGAALWARLLGDTTDADSRFAISVEASSGSLMAPSGFDVPPSMVANRVQAFDLK